MAYHHRHLPSIDRMEYELNKIGMEKFIQKYSKYPIFGDSDSINFVLKIKKLWDIIHIDGGQKAENINH